MGETRLQRPFKVIIAGGSVTGLTLARMLEKASIEWVLLEKRDVVPNVGQTIAAMPCTTLIFEQLGCHQLLEEVGFPLKNRVHYDTNMQLFCSSNEFRRLHKKFGRPSRFIDRFRFLKGIHDAIENKDKIHTREGIVSYTETEHGVEVHTDKGNVFDGSILVGCDGVHSEVRKQMAGQLKDQDPKAAHILSTGFKTRYCAVLSLSHGHLSGDEQRRVFPHDGYGINAYHPKERIGSLCCTGTAGQLIWLVYMPLECIDRTPVDEYPSPKFTQADIDLFLERYGHLGLMPGYTIGDALANLVMKNSVNMIAMEENVLPTRWNNGSRVVIVGDAVHKATANLGLGGNLCVDDVCRLTNGLVRLLKQSDGEPPNTSRLTKVFDDMEKASRPRAKFVQRASSIVCGFETGARWYAPIMKVVYPWIPSSIKMELFGHFDAAAPKLDFLFVPEAKYQEEG